MGYSGVYDVTAHTVTMGNVRDTDSLSYLYYDTEWHTLETLPEFVDSGNYLVEVTVTRGETVWTLAECVVISKI